MPWIRIISEPATELQTLVTRNKLTDERLASQQPRRPLPSENLANMYFTPVSAFQFFIDGIPQGFHKSDQKSFGLVINAVSNRNVIFRNSMRTEVSDNIFKKPSNDSDFEKALKDNNFIKTTDAEVARSIQRSYNDLVKQYKKDRIDYPENGIDPKDAKLPWTEGLFRYKFSDIDGIFVYPDLTSIRNGYAFAKVLENVTRKKNEFYYWDENKSELVRLDREKIKKELGFKTDKSDDTKLVPDQATLAQFNKYNSYLDQAREGGR